METVQTLPQFYQLMRESKALRVPMVDSCLKGNQIPSDQISALQVLLERLTAIEKNGETYRLKLDAQKTIDLDLTYEVEEFKKDIFFLTHSEEEFLAHLAQIHNNFDPQVQDGIARLKDISFSTFITDRDGTVNNYCGRYASSIQSVYNAVFLTRFAQNCVKDAIVLTSAPLMNIGLDDISIAPQGAFVYAASKGREYLDKNHVRRQFPVEEEKQAVLNQLNQRLGELVKKSEYEKFSLIGSGLQYKFGQTTIAHQDISGTIPEEESQNFLNVLKDIVMELDPQKKFFRLEDTGKDLEVILTVESADETGKLKDFDKGDGVLFLNDDLDLRMDQGTHLICGDTKSDVPMVQAALEKSKDTWAVFVGEDEELKEMVRGVTNNSLFVSTPDVLVTILNTLAKK